MSRALELTKLCNIDIRGKMFYKYFPTLFKKYFFLTGGHLPMESVAFIASKKGYAQPRTKEPFLNFEF